MMPKIELFLFVLSLVYSIKYLIVFILNIQQETPQPIKIDKTNQIFLYGSVAYVFTYIIGLFIW